MESFNIAWNNDVASLTLNVSISFIPGLRITRQEMLRSLNYNAFKYDINRYTAPTSSFYENYRQKSPRQMYISDCY